jgi:hypothetical protein
MRRTLLGAVGMSGMVAVAILSAYAVAAPKAPTPRTFTQTDLGAQISARGKSFVAVYRVVSSLDGTGASIQRGSVTGTTFPLSGTDTTTTYFANGVGKSKDQYKLSAVNAQGISTITGSGKCVSGTGVHKTEKCKYTFAGTYNPKTTVAHVKVTGTDTR